MPRLRKNVKVVHSDEAIRRHLLAKAKEGYTLPEEMEEVQNMPEPEVIPEEEPAEPPEADIEEEIPEPEEPEAEIPEIADKQIFSEIFSFSDSNQPLEIDIADIAMDKALIEELRQEVQNSYDQGFEDGQLAAEVSFKHEIENQQKWIRRIDELSDNFRKEYSKELKKFEEALVPLAIMVAENIIKKEIAEDNHIVISQVKNAIAALDDDQIFKIRVNPDEAEILENVKSKLVADRSQIRKTIIAPDESIERGGCVLETSAGSIDSKISTRLEKMREMLSELAQSPSITEEMAKEERNREKS
ncbi:MAG: FliH/SctL family protein [Candidatus Kapaibacterium sp.]